MDYSIITELDLFNKDLIELPDLSQYTNLKTLDCNNNSITQINNLPLSLTELYCSYNKITSLDNLPLSLIKLDCINNQITSLDKLPLSLTKLDCYNNPLTYNFNPTLENIRKHNQTRK